MKKLNWLIPALLGCVLATVSCTSYKSRVVPFRHPSAYPNMQMVAGAQVAAEAYADPGKAKGAFGFNIRKAGLLPVQVVIDNTGSRDLANKELQNRDIQPGMLGRGFLFFPGEAPSASMLRLQLKETGTGKVHTVLLSLK